MKLKPIGARCLITPYKAAEKSESGLLLDNQSNLSAAPVKGIVIEAGESSMFKKGQTIYYRRYSVDQLRILTEKGEEEVNFVDDMDILGVLED